MDEREKLREKIENKLKGSIEVTPDKDKVTTTSQLLYPYEWSQKAMEAIDEFIEEQDAPVRVRLIVDNPDDNTRLKKGDEGTHICTSGTSWYGVSWDGLVRGHDLDGNLEGTEKARSGWFVPPDSVEFI